MKTQQPVLVIQKTGETFHLGLKPVSIGRGSDNAIILTDDKKISRQHVVISLKGHNYVLEDMSANGTFVNGQRVAGLQTLHDKDVLRVGDTEFMALLPPPPAMIEDKGEEATSLLANDSPDEDHTILTTQPSLSPSIPPPPAITLPIDEPDDEPPSPSSPTTPKKSGGIKIFIAVGLVIVLLACGGAAFLVLLGSVFSNATSNVRAMPTVDVPPKTPEPKKTPTPASTKPVEIEFFSYTHPSGAFTVKIPTHFEYNEFATETQFMAEDAFIGLEFADAETGFELDPGQVEDVILQTLDDFVKDGLFLAYEAVEVSPKDNNFVVTFSYTEETGRGIGNVLLLPQEKTLYVLFFLTSEP
ncbi:MAG: FHA domain-containing protein, partial [Anaerolineae bacterium]|nr:FHA domain-containing protein [Anaerolineae bacterium]